MAISRRTASLPPLLLRNASRSSRTYPLPLSRRHPTAVAVLIPSRRALYSTEASTSQSGPSGNFPPPGFNAEEAKKPLQRQETSPRQAPSSKEAEELEAAAAGSKPEAQPKTSADPAEHEVATSEPKAGPAHGPTMTEAAERAKLVDHSTEKLAEEKKKDGQKLTVWQKVKREANHYWDGTKLLGTETKISFKLALKMAAGYELTRREHRQVCPLQDVEAQIMPVRTDTPIFYSSTAQSKIWAD